VQRVVDRSSTLSSDPVVGVLRRLHREADVGDPEAKSRVLAREAELGRGVSTAERYDLCGGAPLAVTSEVGELLYVLALSCKPAYLVEFGASLGVSTLYLAAAVRDLGGGSLLTTEIDPGKAARAARNLVDAGLGDLVELRVGDALKSLEDLPGSVDFLFLDGRNDFYLGVLRMVEPVMSPGALVVADLSEDDPDLLPYLGYVRDRERGYRSVCIPLDAGIEVSVRAGEPAMLF
jgi:predicted O-methyltransferase YrrM